MEDPGEALYYLRKVAKKDPTYRALGEHLQRLETMEPHAKGRAGSEPPHPAAHAAPTRTVDAAPHPEPENPGGAKPEDKAPAPGAPKKKISYL
jgi:hypothetical protein